MRDYQRYWREVAGQAYSDTLAQFGWQGWGHWVINAIIFIGALFVLRRWDADAQMNDQIQWLTATLMSGGVVLIVILLSNLAFAPFRVWRADQQKKEKLRQQLMERRIPKNRDELVRYITEYERAAGAYIIKHHALVKAQRENPDRKFPNNFTSEEKIRLKQAEDNFETSRRIAGPDFDIRLHMYSVDVWLAVSGFIESGDPDYESASSTIREETRKVLDLLDKGQLYSFLGY